MAMTESVLMLEVGSEALSDLTADEKSAVLAAYTDAQVKYAAMKVFDLLRKKFQPTYRMGRMYKALSDKYSMYDKIYKEYTSSVTAGSTASDEDDVSDILQFLESTND